MGVFSYRVVHDTGGVPFFRPTGFCSGLNGGAAGPRRRGTRESFPGADAGPNAARPATAAESLHDGAAADRGTSHI